ncbi:MAG: hypothetical protein AAB758_01100 [Patescibacteria group bacterium]
MTIVKLLNNINKFVLNPLITLAFAIALLVFFIGIFQFINSETADSKREQGKKKILWGLVGMFIMISAYGLIRIILGTFDITPPSYLNLR